MFITYPIILFGVQVSCIIGYGFQNADETGTQDARVVFVKYECEDDRCERCVGTECTQEQLFSTLETCQLNCGLSSCKEGRVRMAKDLQNFHARFPGIESCSENGGLYCQQACESSHLGQFAVGFCVDEASVTCTCQFCALPGKEEQCDEHSLHFVPAADDSCSEACAASSAHAEAESQCWIECREQYGDKLTRAECDQFGCTCAVCDSAVKRYFCTTSNRCDECNFHQDCPTYVTLFETRSQCGEVCDGPPKHYQCSNEQCMPCEFAQGNEEVEGLNCRSNQAIYNNEEDCLDNCTSKCNENEVYQECASSCHPSCDDPFPTVCIQQCIPGCHCREGYIRDPDNDMACILPDDCPNPVCAEDKVWSSCGRDCQPTCDTISPVCDMKSCLPGCVCRPTYLLDSFDNCVRPFHCPRCGQNEVFLNCGPACRPTCSNPVPETCTQPCTSGCFCAQGFIWDTDSQKCVFQNECSDPICEEGKLFNECTCFPSCDRPSCHDPASTDCEAGCECEGDQLLGPGGMCMDPDCAATGDNVTVT